MIRRIKHEAALGQLLRHNAVVALVGPRQVGKTTLARAVARQAKTGLEFFDLERTGHLGRFTDPLLVLARLEGLVVLDEVQFWPELFSTLRVLAERRPLPARFLVISSAELPERLVAHPLSGVCLSEVKPDAWKKLWRRGGFPASYGARTEELSWRWREAFVRTFVQADLPQLGVGVPAPTMLRFWTMLSRVHAQIVNYSQLGGSLGVGDTTVRRYLDALLQTFMVRALRPWRAGLGKREVKAPKVFLRDSGLLHSLLGIRSELELLGSPYAGASFEGFAIEQLIDLLGLEEPECFFWSTYQGAGIDFLVVRGEVRRGFEFKLTVAPTVTRSMQIALTDLKLDQIDVVHAGEHTFQLAPKIRAVAIGRLAADVRL